LTDHRHAEAGAVDKANVEDQAYVEAVRAVSEEACLNLVRARLEDGDLRHYFLDDKGKDSQARARELLGRMCAEDQAAACRLMAKAHSRFDPADKRTYNALMEKSCRLGDAAGCEEHGKALLNDDDSANRNRAVEAFTMACGHDRRSSCLRLAKLEITDKATWDEGMRRLISACENGHSTSCVFIASLSAPVVNDRPDCDEAVKFAQRACDAKDEDGCAIVEACRTIEPGGQRRLQWLQEACGRESSMACLYWADLQQSGPGPRAEPAAIQRAYATACKVLADLWPVACVRSAIMELEAAKRSSEKDEQVSRLQKFCEQQSSAEACCSLGQAYLNGSAIPQDKEQARKLRARGCELGRKDCCAPID
jgi:TPR repeat protein